MALTKQQKLYNFRIHFKVDKVLYIIKSKEKNKQDSSYGKFRGNEKMKVTNQNLTFKL